MALLTGKGRAKKPVARATGFAIRSADQISGWLFCSSISLVGSVVTRSDLGVDDLGGDLHIQGAACARHQVMAWVCQQIAR